MILLCFVPSIVFWMFAGGLHLLGANDAYTGKVSLYSMLSRQLLVDFMQTGFNLISILVEPPHMHIVTSRVVLACAIIEVVEYSAHRFYHSNAIIYKYVHKQHHQIVQLHTFASFYNSINEILLTGAMLGICFRLFAIDVLTIIAASSIATIFTVMDHCTWTGDFHAKHHRLVGVNFSQPFTRVLDVLFGTTA